MVHSELLKNVYNSNGDGYHLLIIYVNDPPHFYNWNNDVIDISLIKTTKNKYITRMNQHHLLAVNMRYAMNFYFQLLL